MKTTSRRLLTAVLLAASLGVTALFLRANDAPKTAPAWSLTDLNGKALSSADLAGKTVVVDFWATWCGPCVQEIPGYIELQKKYADQGLVIVGISLDDRGADYVKTWAEKRGINYPVVMGDQVVAEAFGGIEAIPTTFIVNRAGQIVEQKRGAMAHAAFEALLKKHL